MKREQVFQLVSQKGSPAMERFPMTFSQKLSLSLFTVMQLWGAAGERPAWGETHCVSIEIYVNGQTDANRETINVLKAITEQRDGAFIVVQNLDGEQREKAQSRLKLIARHFSIDASQTPIVYGCNQVLQNWPNQAALSERVKQMLRLDAYVRSGCPHCRDAKIYLKKLAQSYPGFEFRFHEIIGNAQARRDMDRLVRHYQVAAVSVPVIHVCNRLIVGFDQPSTTGRRIEAVLNSWTYPCRQSRKTSDLRRFPPPSIQRAALLPIPNLLLAHSSEKGAAPVGDTIEEGELPPLLPLPPLPMPSEGHEPMLPVPGNDASLPVERPPPELQPETMALPIFGRVNARQLGLPLFTIVIGLVDGFNPCAIWVLMILLSILVNLRSRAKILAVAGTFVFISGLAYFAFMAAWLNVFRLIGLLRPVQITLALIAITVGAVHVKDFFAFKKGVSFSIPDAAKPGIYTRVHRIVTAENLSGAIIGASILAVLVNIVELLCTAGLPALYTEILTMRGLPMWQNYAYLLLYNLAYMFDDALMVTVVVVTLNKTKMQESHGRWLKLLSGSVILILGVVMLIRPQWLV